MKFGKGDPHERKSLIHEYLTKVGLEAKSYASRTIGGDLGGGIVIRGLSGGERKRLALACTLALKPRILFIDELTRYVTCAKFPYLSCSKRPGNIQIISFPSQSQITRAAV